MQANAQTGQLFSSYTAGRGGDEGAGQEPPSYQPAKALPGEGAEYDALVFDMAAAGFEPVHWTRPKADLRFTMRQTTIHEHCRAMRLLDESRDQNSLARNLFMVSIKSIGDLADPGDEAVLQWLDDLRAVGSRLVDRAYQHLCHPTTEQDKLFQASKAYDPASRTFTYRIPRSVLPKKTAASFRDDELTFSMRELSVGEMSAASDAVDDPDDSYALRVMQVMWSIASIGGKPLDVSADSLLVRRRWLARVGHLAWMMIAGTYTRMHEVDRGLVDRFLSSASAPA